MKLGTTPFFVFFLVLSSPVFAQQVAEFSFGEGDWNNVVKVWEVPGGNLNLLAGESDEVALYRLSPQGDILWRKYFATSGAGSLLAEADDDGSLWFGHLGGGGYKITHYDPDGNQISSISYSHPDLWDDYYFSAKRTPDKQHFILSFKDQDPPMGIRTVKLSLTGTVVFNKYITYNDPIFDPFFFSSYMDVLSNGRVVVTVYDWQAGYGFHCYSPSGVQLWTSPMYQVPDFPEECGIIPLSNGSFVFRVKDSPTGGGAVCISSSGNLLWQTSLDFSPHVGFADGDNVILAGDPYIGAPSLAVAKIDASGNFVFEKTFNQLNGYEEFHGAKTSHGDYVFSGFTWECCYHNDKSYLLNLQPNGLTNWLVHGVRTINNIDCFSHCTNGDIWMGGNFKDPNSPNMRNNYLIRASGLPPVNPQLLTGRVVLDESANCQAEQGEQGLPYHIVRAEAAGKVNFAVAQPNGNYALRLPNANNASVKVLTPNSLWQPCQPSFNASFASGDTATLDLPVTQLAQCPVLRLDAGAPLLRRCFDNNYEIHWCNEGSSDATAATLTVELDSFFIFVSASLPPVSQAGNTLTFDLGNLPKNGCGHLKLTVNVSCNAALGQTHCLTANIAATNGCPSFEGGLSTAVDCQPNIGSFDPNDVRAFANDSLIEGEILAGTDIEYQIRFQNTGTDTAFNISIIDSLSKFLDLGTLRMGTSSHPYTWEIKNGNLLKIDFAGINLPDSTINEPGSHGFAQFRISQNPHLPNGTKIFNQAAIFFDFNEPVITNLHLLTIKNPVAVTEAQSAKPGIQVTPNPVTGGQVRVQSTKSGGLITTLAVYNTTGQLLRTFEPNTEWLDLTLPSANETFFLVARLENGQIATAKVVKQ